MHLATVILVLVLAAVSADYPGSHVVDSPSAISYHNTYRAPQRRVGVDASQVYSAAASDSVPVVAAHGHVVPAHGHVVSAHGPVVATHGHAPSAISYHNTYRAPQRRVGVAASQVYSVAASDSVPMVAAHGHVVPAYGHVVPAHGHVVSAHGPVVATHGHAPSAISYHNTYRAPQGRLAAAGPLSYATAASAYSPVVAAPASYATAASVHSPAVAAHDHVVSAHAPSAISYHNTYKISKSHLAAYR